MFLESTPVATPVRGARARLQWLDEYSVPCPQFARRDKRCSHTMPPLSCETVAAPTVCVGASMRNDICRPAPVSTCVPRLLLPWSRTCIPRGRRLCRCSPYHSSLLPAAFPCVRAPDQRRGCHPANSSKSIAQANPTDARWPCVACAYSEDLILNVISLPVRPRLRSG